MSLSSGQNVAGFDQVTNLKVARCPHCRIANPLLLKIGSHFSHNHANSGVRYWLFSSCQTCGGVVVAGVPHDRATGISRGEIEIYPEPPGVSAAIPAIPRRYLEQANNTLNAPDGAVLLAASAVDAMLKEKGLKVGSLYARIDKAVEAHILTADMAAWAHQVRLEANDARHADEGNPHHDEPAAASAVEFATALAEFLFVLPARVTRGIVAAGGTLPKAAPGDAPKPA